MACGRPVIASRVGGLQTTVLDDVTGLLVPDHDGAALAAAIERILDDGSLRWRLGREGVRWAARHRWPCVAEAICREYAGLTADAASHVGAGRCQE
jgi:glycosyltransferase involved in cell wall biosynthesis